MKRAKVSALYEGKGRKRKRAELEEEEEVERGKKARQRAKARKYGFRANARTHYGLSPRRKVRKTSMETVSDLVVEEGNQEMGKASMETVSDLVVGEGNQEMEKVEVEVEEKSSEVEDDEVKPVGEVAEMLEEELKRLDWPPVSMSYEEENWLGLGTRWDPYWDVMTGDVWLGGEGVVEENDWVVNIWDN